MRGERDAKSFAIIGFGGGEVLQAMKSNAQLAAADADLHLL
jgi:hypothetical protein